MIYFSPNQWSHPCRLPCINKGARAATICCKILNNKHSLNSNLCCSLIFRTKERVDTCEGSIGTGTYCLWPYCHLLFNVNESLHTLTKIPLLLNISYNSQYSLFVLPKLSICGTLITRQQQHPPPLHPSNPLTSKLLSSWSLDFFYKKLFKYVCKLWPHFRQSIKFFFLFFAFLVENSTSCLPL